MATNDATAKHTPGPYEIGEHDDIDSNIDICVQGAVIATVLGSAEFPCLDPQEYDFEAFHSERVATARLMAAAPSMLDQLTLMLHIVECEARAQEKLPLAKKLGRWDWAGIAGRIRAVVDEAVDGKPDVTAKAK